MADTELRERLARAACMADGCWICGPDKPCLDISDCIHFDSWTGIVDAILTEAEAAGLVLAERIPHEGKVS